MLKRLKEKPMWMLLILGGGSAGKHKAHIYGF